MIPKGGLDNKRLLIQQKKKVRGRTKKVENLQTWKGLQTLEELISV